MANPGSEDAPILSGENEAPQLGKVRRSYRTVLFAGAALLACSLLAALAAGVVLSRRTLPGMLGGHMLLGKYEKRDGVLPDYKVAGRMKSIAANYGVANPENSTARDPILRKMMDASGAADVMVGAAFDRLREPMLEGLEAARRHAKDIGLELPASKRGRLDVAGAAKRLEQRRKRREARRLQAAAAEVFPLPRRPEAPDQSAIEEQIREQAANSLSLGLCVTSANAALVTVANAGLDLNAALLVCRNNTIDGNQDFSRLDCASNALDFIGQVSGLAAILATMPSLCNLQNDLKAICASDISLFVSAAATFAGDGITLKQDCPGFEEPGPVWGLHGGANQPRFGYAAGQEPIRRLREAPPHDLQGWWNRWQERQRRRQQQAKELEKEEQLGGLDKLQQMENDQALANCWMFIYAATNDAAAVALDIWASQQDCANMETEDERATCAADIISTIADFSQILSDALSAAANCPICLPPRVACVADGFDIAVQALTFGAWGAVIKQDCVDLEANLHSDGKDYPGGSPIAALLAK
mmetsp:Transcript_118405/g.315131  ORF Transcript_118405/g.315131 Transcript_118405/m.315131 type:complete len:531 (-) Transcript_118405:117-1709(-)